MVQRRGGAGLLDPAAQLDVRPRRQRTTRYEQWSNAAGQEPDDWAEAESTFTHPEYVDSAFLLHDLGVVELSEPIRLDEYGTLPEADYLDRYAGTAKQQALFESVGYGLEDSGPKFSVGGDTRRKADRRLISFKGAYGYRDIAVKFSHARLLTTAEPASATPAARPSTSRRPRSTRENIIVAVTSFGLNYNCNASGSYRIDQPDDLAFLADPAGAGLLLNS